MAKLGVCMQSETPFGAFSSVHRPRGLRYAGLSRTYWWLMYEFERGTILAGVFGFPFGAPLGLLVALAFAPCALCVVECVSCPVGIGRCGSSGSSRTRLRAMHRAERGRRGAVGRRRAWASVARHLATRFVGATVFWAPFLPISGLGNYMAIMMLRSKISLPRGRRPKSAGGYMSPGVACVGASRTATMPRPRRRRSHIIPQGH